MIKILIAEDEADIRDLVMFTLQFEGYEVLTAVNGQEAVDKAPEFKPDLILMDVRMPRMTGYEACKVLKKQDATKDIPVVFLSAKGQDVEVKQGIEAGAVDYILKPFSPDLLLHRLKQIVKVHVEDKAKEKAENKSKGKAKAAEAKAPDKAQVKAKDAKDEKKKA